MLMRLCDTALDMAYNILSLYIVKTVLNIRIDYVCMNSKSIVAIIIIAIIHILLLLTLDYSFKL